MINRTLCLYGIDVITTTCATTTIDDLTSDLLTDFIFRYVGDKQFRFVAMVNHSFYSSYTSTYPTKRTSKHTSNIDTMERLRIFIQEVGRRKSVKAMKYLKDMVMNLAAKYGNMENVHLFHQCHPNITVIETPKIFARAALYGYFDGIQQLYATLGGQWDDFACSNAAQNGHLEVLQYAHGNGCAWDAWTCSNAALHGHLNVLKFAHEQGCPWTEHTCSNAALNGHLHILEYARVNGCPWNEFTCSNAALNGHMVILVYAHTRTCPWNSYTCSNAAQNGHLDILKYARMFHCPWTHHTIQKAVEHGHIDVARWARRNGCHGSFVFDTDWDDDDDFNFDPRMMALHDDDDEVLLLARTMLRSIMREQH